MLVTDYYILNNYMQNFLRPEKNHRPKSTNITQTNFLMKSQYSLIWILIYLVPVMKTFILWRSLRWITYQLVHA